MARKIFNWTIGPALWVGFVLSASAQTAVQDIETRVNADQGRTAAPLAKTEIQFTSQRPPTNSDEIVFQLNDIVLEGASLFDSDSLKAPFADELGTEVSLRRIYEMAGLVQGLYRDADYIFTRVVVPAQEIDGGIVRLEVIEAQVITVSVEEPGEPVGPVRELIERLVEPLRGLVNPTGAALERVLLNVNDVPGLFRATAVPQVSAGAERGGLDLFINIERDPYEGVLYADNRQTPGVGRGLAGATATYNSYSNAGDTTSVSIFNSFAYQTFNDPATGQKDGAFDFDERNTVLVTHQRNVGSDGLVVRGQALFSRTRPGDGLANVGIEGNQYLIGIEAEYPLLRSRSLDLGAVVGAELFDSETDVSNGAFRVADDQIRIAYASIEGLSRDEIGYTRANLTLRQGLDILGATDNTSPNRSRNDGRSDFTLIKAEIDRFLVINEDLSLFLRLAGQYAFDPLLASEEFAIGGTTFGRGFDPSEFTGDHGIGMSAEFRYVTPFTVEGYPITLENYAFGDYGLVWNKGQGVPDHERILSLGGGMRFFLPEDFLVGLEIAVPVSEALERQAVGGGDITGARFFVNLSKRF